MTWMHSHVFHDFLTRMAGGNNVRVSQETVFPLETVVYWFMPQHVTNVARLLKECICPEKQK